jgi:hypothetical protein
VGCAAGVHRARRVRRNRPAGIVSHGRQHAGHARGRGHDDRDSDECLHSRGRTYRLAGHTGGHAAGVADAARSRPQEPREQASGKDRRQRRR